MRGIALCLATAAALLGVSGPATASTVSVWHQWREFCGEYAAMTYFAAGPGETNRLTVGNAEEDPAYDQGLTGIFDHGPVCTRSPVYVDGMPLQDGGAVIADAPDCARLRPQFVLCEASPLTAWLGDGNDQLLSTYDYPVHVYGGAGDDTLRLANLAHDHVSCGTGSDTVIVGIEDSISADCESVTRTPA